MKNKIIGIVVCMLMIVTVLPATGAANVQNVLPVASGLIGIKIVATVTRVTDSNNLLGGAIHVNDTITGKYIYNSGAPDIEPDPNIGAYLSTTSPCGIELKAGDFVFKTDPSDIDLGIAIWNDYVLDEYPPTDEFVLDSLNNLPLSNGMLINFIQWSLTDTTATALSSTDLPTSAPVLTDWNDENSLLIEGKSPSNPDQTCRIKAQVTKATKGKVIDLHGVESGTPSIIIPYQYNILFMQFWLKLFERFPNAFPILRYLMG